MVDQQNRSVPWPVAARALHEGGFSELTLARRLALSLVTLPGRMFVAWIRAIGVLAGGRE